MVGGSHYPQVGVSVIGLTPVTFSGSPSISGGVTISGTPSISGGITVTNAPSVFAAVSGSVVGFQGGTWQPSALGYLTRNDAVASFLGRNSRGWV